MAAFAEALRQGADAIELDVQTSADGVAIVHHDRTLQKVAGVRRSVADLSLAELRELDAGAWFHPAFAGERLPTLDAVLRRFGRRTRTMIEIKVDDPRRRDAQVDAVIELIEAHDLAARVCVLSFDRAALRRVHRRAPELRCVLDHDARPELATLGALLGPADTLCLPARMATVALGEALRGSGRRLWVYRCDTPRSLATALRAGAEAVITDRPAWARAELRASSPPSTPSRSRAPSPAGRR
jgi:glycerophosphoryl diester phosphodiesterase